MWVKGNDLILRQTNRPRHLFGWLVIGAILTLVACAQQGLTPALVREKPPAAAETALATVADPADPIPARDLVVLIEELRGSFVPRVTQTSPTPYIVGEVRPFWVKNLDGRGSKQIDARLAYRSAQLNMWVQDDQRVAETTIAAAADRISEQILPLSRAFFGREWSPGVDGDPRINILHVAELGALGIAYFSSADEYVTAVNPYSNQREMLYVSLKDAAVGSEQYFATIAHEIQHMIQWHVDQNEDAWLNEGLSELAGHIQGYATNREQSYAAMPDIQLTDLQQEVDVINAHYAAAFLFTAYFRDRFGEAATQALVQHPYNGPAGFSAVLSDLETGLTFDDLLADWLVTNYLSSINRAEGIYQYATLSLPTLATQSVTRLPMSATTTVRQYGADFWRLAEESPVSLSFSGSRQVDVLKAKAHSGDNFWLSYPADKSALSLTRRVDLSRVSQATLQFWTWYELEAGWDYGYVTISADGGQSWQILDTESTTTDNPEGNSFGPGYTGNSGGRQPDWTQETADLTPFAGGEILLRFLVVTDDAVHLQGMAIDDITIPEIGYADDAESGPAGWDGAGFVRVANSLPQQFLVQLLLLGEAGVEVRRLPLDENLHGQWEVPLGSTYNEAVIIVTGTTPFTRQAAVYELEFRQP